MKLEDHTDEEFLGRSVKIPFDTYNPEYQAEYIWVKITKVTSRFFSGTLASHPRVYKGKKYGDEVVFSRRKIRDVFPEFERK